MTKIDFAQAITAEDKAAQAKLESRNERIAELKRFLDETDYKALPDYDKDASEIIVERKSAREEIRKLS